jgi:hypothetical protein
MFTVVLIVLVVVGAIVIIANEVRSWRRPGHHIDQNAPMDSEQTNTARLMHDTNIHDSNLFGGGPFSM